MTIKDQGASINIKLSQIVPSKTNPRKHFGEEMLKEMAASVEQHGILQPILVRTPRDGKYEIVAGETRYRAACMTSLEEVPCLVRELSDFEALEIQVLENLHRNDLTPMEEAQGFKQLLDKSEDIAAYTIDQLADKIGKSRTYVYDSLKLLELPDDATNALHSGELNRSTALLVARLAPDVQTSALKKLKQAAENGQSASYREAKGLIKQELAESDVNKLINEMIANFEASGETVIDLRNPELKSEWASFGIMNLGYKLKSGYVADDTRIDVESLGRRIPVSSIIEGQEKPAGTIYLVGSYMYKAYIKPAYPEDAIHQLLQEAIASGRISPTPSVPPTERDIKQQQRQAETTRRREYATQLIAEIACREPSAAAMHIAIQLMIRLAIEHGYWGSDDYQLMAPLGVKNEEEIEERLQLSTYSKAAALALAFFAAHHFEAPYDTDDGDDAWLEIKKIAILYGLPVPESPTEQPPTPPAAAQAQEDIAPEKADPAIEAAGELSEEEASLAGEPAAQVKEQTPPAARTAAQKRMDDIKARTLARKARKESANADVSNTAPTASAAGETNRNEVAA